MARRPVTLPSTRRPGPDPNPSGPASQAPVANIPATNLNPSDQGVNPSSDGQPQKETSNMTDQTAVQSSSEPAEQIAAQTLPQTLPGAEALPDAPVAPAAGAPKVPKTPKTPLTPEQAAAKAKLDEARRAFQALLPQKARKPGAAVGARAPLYSGFDKEDVVTATEKGSTLKHEGNLKKVRAAMVETTATDGTVTWENTGVTLEKFLQNPVVDSGFFLYGLDAMYLRVNGFTVPEAFAKLRALKAAGELDEDEDETAAKAA